MGGTKAQYNEDGSLAGQPNLFQQVGAMPNPQGNVQDYSRQMSLPATAQAYRDTNAFKQQAQQGASNIGTNFNQFVPKLNTNFAAQPGMDATSQGLLAQGNQSINRGIGAAQANIARTVRGPSAGVLQNQAAFQGRLNANPLMFQVAQNQVGRQQQETRLGNEALLAQQGASNAGQSASNAAITQQVGLQGLPVAAQQNMVSLLKAQQGK